jgi:protein gp37
MGKDTNISWAHHTWNPWQGCTWASPGCDHCYMYAWAERFHQDPTVVRKSQSTWNDPYTWHRKALKEGKRKRVFTCSLSDFFHQDADAWRNDAWKVIRETPALDYLILTKRPGRIHHCLPDDWGNGYRNVWLGVSIESKTYLWRMAALKTIPAPVRWLSVEPLLEDLGILDLTGIQWVVVGGESGNRSNNFRPMDHAWARAIRDQCVQHGVAFFFKQSSGWKDGLDPELQEEDGTRTVWEQFPQTNAVSNPSPQGVRGPQPQLL